MLPRRALLPSLTATTAPGLRRSHILYLLLLLVCASALGSWVHQLSARTLAPPSPAGLQRAAALPADAGKADRLEAGMEALQRQLSQLTDALASAAAPRGAQAAAGTASSAAAAPAQAQVQAQVQAQAQPLPPPAARRARPMVLGMAKGLDAVGVYRFVRSLRTHSPDARIVIFTDQASLDASALLPWAYAAFDVTLQMFDTAALPARVQAYHPSSYRWILMRDYMRSTAAAAAAGAPLGPVFFTDVRDTVFQGDLFARLEERGLYVFQEQRPGTIAACGWNSGWVKDCFGEEGLRKVGHNVVSCSGTSAGDWEDALAYVELMGAFCLRPLPRHSCAVSPPLPPPPPLHAAKSLEDMPHCERNGIDQGMHNFFVYGGALQAAVSALHLVSNEEGFIATVQSMPSVPRDLAGRVLNAQGAVVAAVHQYDRSPVLKRQYEGEYPLPPEGELNSK